MRMVKGTWRGDVQSRCLCNANLARWRVLYVNGLGKGVEHGITIFQTGVSLRGLITVIYTLPETYSVQ